MILLVPDAIPVTIPETEPIVAFTVLPLLHTPVPVASVSKIVDPTHTDVAPLTGNVALTVTVAVARLQPPPLAK